MYQSVLYNNRYTKEELIELYNNELIKLGDTVLYNKIYGLNNSYNITKFIKIKRLKSLLSLDNYKDTFKNFNYIDTLLIKFKDTLTS